jgi:hypothetical protein
MKTAVSWHLTPRAAKAGSIATFAGTACGGSAALTVPIKESGGWADRDGLVAAFTDGDTRHRRSGPASYPSHLSIIVLCAR